jgi:hypothetical protein
MRYIGISIHFILIIVSIKCMLILYKFIYKYI